MTTTGDQSLNTQVRSDRLLKLFLIVIGVADLLALVAVFLPTPWLGWAHEVVGLGSLPPGRIVGYLARSTSLLYGIQGAMLLVMAGDIERYRQLIRWYGRVLIIAGLLLVCVDIAESMPAWWTVFEGVAVVGIGVVILALCQVDPAKIKSEGDRPA